jgi:hypothetical protein
MSGYVAPCGHWVPSETVHICDITATRPACWCCPVCEGRGHVPAGFYHSVAWQSWSASSLTPEKCRSCDGTGVVWR